jgi:transcriptional regulator with XRE-family HTH domain
MITTFSLITANDAAATIGQKIRQHRIAADITQSELAAQVHVSPSTLKRIEAHGGGSLKDVMAIAIALGIDRDILDAIPRPPLRSLADLDGEGRRIERTRTRAARRSSP